MCVVSLRIGSNTMNRAEMENCVMKILGLPRESHRVCRVLGIAREMATVDGGGSGGDDVDFISFFDILVEGNVLAESRVMAVTNLFRLMDFDRSGSLVMSEVKSILYAAVGLSLTLSNHPIKSHSPSQSQSPFQSPSESQSPSQAHPHSWLASGGVRLVVYITHSYTCTNHNDAYVTSDASLFNCNVWSFPKISKPMQSRRDACRRVVPPTLLDGDIGRRHGHLTARLWFFTRVRHHG